ncbi:hypothetical protein ZIOFF_068873 [Zingiber officinale]|uniref:Uncharacterized protein n=1 Tax=Zingiber officinale TaxID=94328 RepID=A0A8J5CB14_ZINOF|nr:hypothetical protein ZIOFF_068873 [Zingiber officinale]
MFVGEEYRCHCPNGNVVCLVVPTGAEVLDEDLTLGITDSLAGFVMWLQCSVSMVVEVLIFNCEWSSPALQPLTKTVVSMLLVPLLSVAHECKRKFLQFLSCHKQLLTAILQCPFEPVQEKKLRIRYPMIVPLGPSRQPVEASARARSFKIVALGPSRQPVEASARARSFQIVPLASSRDLSRQPSEAKLGHEASRACPTPPRAISLGKPLSFHLVPLTASRLCANPSL